MLPKDPIKRQETLLKLKAAAQRRAKDPEWLKNNSNSHKGKPSWNKGIKLTDTHKERISKSRIGMVASIETKNKMSKSHEGFKHTEESKNKIRKSHKGVKKTKDHIENNRKSHLGQIPWNVGISPTEEFLLQMIETKVGGFWYGVVNNDLSIGQLIRKLKQYKIWVRGVLERDQYKDVTTGKLCEHPEAHHVIKLTKLIKMYNIKTLDDAINCKELWDIDNGITLEYENHMKIHGFKY